MIKNSLIRTLKLASLGLTAWYVIKNLYRDSKKVNVQGRVVLITGGSRGLGLAIARELASKGARLALCARDAEHLNKVSKEFTEKGYSIFIHAADVTDSEQVQQMVEQVIRYYGHIDIVINNAGIMLVGPDQVMEIADYKSLMESNCWSSLYTTKALVPHFKAQGIGHIVNICSIGSKISVPHMVPYSVSKFALIGLSQGLASELAHDNILVTTVVPNLMRTGSPRNISVKGNHQAEYAWFKLASSLPMISQSADVAAKRIVEGIEFQETQITLTFTAKLAVALQALAPDLIGGSTRLAGRLMPSSDDSTVKKGYESESKITQGAIGSITDEAAIKFNQF